MRRPNGGSGSAVRRSSPAVAAGAAAGATALLGAVALHAGGCGLERMGTAPGGPAGHAGQSAGTSTTTTGAGASGLGGIGPGGHGGQGGSGGEAGQAGDGGEGGAPDCTSPEGCPGEDSECATRTCLDGKCGIDYAPASSPCTDGGGDVCDGEGDCVKSAGLGCAQGSECLSGFCADKVCCDSACGGTCVLCDAQGFAGACVPVGAGTDPDSECALAAVCDGSGACAAGGHLASVALGGTDAEHAWSVAVDNSGAALVTGYFKGSANLGSGWLTSAGQNDVFVTKLDGQLKGVWSKRFGDGGDQRGHGVAVDGAGNVLLTGIFRGTIDFGTGPLVSANNGKSDVFVAKLDPTGKAVWSKRFGNGAQDQTSWRLATNGTGGVVVVGQLAGTVDYGGGPLTGAGSADVFLLVLDAAGAHVASYRFGDASEQVPCDVAIDASGDLLVAGYFKGSINLGGGALASTPATAYDIFVAKLDPTGNHLWSKRFGGTADDQLCHALAAGSGKNIIIGGDFRHSLDFGGGPLIAAGNTDAYVAKLDPDGKHLWSKRFGDLTFPQGVFGLGTDAAGNVMIVGDYQGSIDLGGGALASAGNWDIFAAKLSASGVHLWSKRFGDVLVQYGNDAVVDGAGALLFTGYFTGSVDFGGGALSATGASEDVYVAKLGP